MHQVRIVAGIGHVDGHRHAFAQPQQRPRNLAVVRNRFDRYARTNLQRAGIDAEGVVGLSRWRGARSFFVCRGSAAWSDSAGQQRACRRDESFYDSSDSRPVTFGGL